MEEGRHGGGGGPTRGARGGARPARWRSTAGTASSRRKQSGRSSKAYGDGEGADRAQHDGTGREQRRPEAYGGGGGRGGRRDDEHVRRGGSRRAREAPRQCSSSPRSPEACSSICQIWATKRLCPALKQTFGTGWYHQPVPKGYWYLLVAPTGTKGIFYFLFLFFFSSLFLFPFY